LLKLVAEEVLGEDPVAQGGGAVDVEDQREVQRVGSGAERLEIPR
jgi:hypothetical protein